MKKIIYRTLIKEELNDDLLINFNRFQETNRVWYKDNDQYHIKEDHFVEKWEDNKKIQVIQALRECMKSGGLVMGAFDNTNLVGFANVEGELFGSREEYLELPFIHVSNELRGSGIGKKLIEFCCEGARNLGAKKLYIAAHPSIETQHFYKSVGCTYAVEINERILAKEPLDIQMELVL
ncbi:GNAT family N-acetyltransferase [Peribacillus alkalitolerans]|uniref:GNAT family N-acetyltransferase n=1 Tax=Peribacillus alkalitolerans TaxID=1550385 RepID=UPI0013D57457|nr:GNAT family N-acetyltransferase [Peribacillus alkalitolerans]